MPVLRQLAKFGMVGLLNTGITLITILVLTYVGVPLIAANALGFALGLTNSFFLNRAFTFRSSSSGVGLPFIISFAVSYAANLLVVLLISRAITSEALTQQILGMLAYNITFFLLMKVWVFAKPAK